MAIQYIIVDGDGNQLASLKAMTPNDAWETYVGSDSAADYTTDGLTTYVAEAPTCESLTEDGRAMLLEKLIAHQKRATAEPKTITTDRAKTRAVSALVDAAKRGNAKDAGVAAERLRFVYGVKYPEMLELVAAAGVDAAAFDALMDEGDEG